MPAVSNSDLTTQDVDTVIKSWSYSRAENFKKCKYRAKLLYVDKLQEPRPPLRPGQTEYANDRGTRIHEAAELYVKGGVELLPELAAFSEEYARLRELYAEGKVSLEGEWAFDNDWAPVGYMSKDVWQRTKLDIHVTMDKSWVLVVDLKTGKRYGNELKHAQQTQLYGITTLLRNPEIKRVTTELWYTDLDELVRTEYTRDQAMRFFKHWNDLGTEITTETEFPPNPNKYSCQYCLFGPKGSGVCKVGV